MGNIEDFEDKVVSWGASMPTSTWNAIDIQAHKEHRTRSNMILVACLEYIKNHGGEQ
jgi:hypothetical protein